MRLGAQICIKPNTLAARLYGKDQVSERHRQRFEFNSQYRESFEAAGLIVSGSTEDNDLVEMVEIKNHRFYIAASFIEFRE